MSIVDDFSAKSEALFTPEHIYGSREKLADVCVVTFSGKVLEKVLWNIRLRSPQGLLQQMEKWKYI